MKRFHVPLLGFTLLVLSSPDVCLASGAVLSGPELSRFPYPLFSGGNSWEVSRASVQVREPSRGTAAGMTAILPPVEKMDWGALEHYADMQAVAGSAL